ncbi:MAG: MBL fold metallo-hydrolase [Candidatus Anstonellaceae archaeon]
MRIFGVDDFKRVLKDEEIYYLEVKQRLCSNRYLIKNNQGQILLIDAGDGMDKVNFKPDICILTHGHFDHSRGVQPNWECFISEKEDPNLIYMYIPKNVKKIKQKEFIFGKYELKIIHTPGHTPGSICIFEKNTKVLFSGDTLFAANIPGRTDLGGSEKQIQESLKKLEKLKWRVLCPGHGEIEYSL